MGEEEKEVTNVTKTRLIYLLVVASLLAYVLAVAMSLTGMSDGGRLF